MIAEEAWRCDICKTRFDAGEEPAVDCNLADMPVVVFQAKFPGHNPKKGRNTIICHVCAEKGGMGNQYEDGIC